MRACKLIVALGAAAMVTGAASAQSITTLFDGGNGGSSGWGVFFNVEIFDPVGLTFTGIDLNARNGDGTPMDVEIYIFDAGEADLSAAGGDSASSAGWSLVSTGTAIGGANNVPTFFDLTNFSLTTGVHGFMVRSTGVGQNYTNGNGANQFFSNSDLSLTLGVTRSGADGFGGSFFNPRVWNGTLYYQPIPAPGALALLGLAGACGMSRRRRA